MGDRTLLEWALRGLFTATDQVAVNAHHHRAQLAEVVHELGSSTGRPLHLSVEPDRALGTAGAIGLLRDWLDGRDVLIVNADTWHRAELDHFVDGWDRDSVRVLTTTTPPFGPRSSVVASLLPWRDAVHLRAEPSGLWERVWREALAQGRIDAVHSTAEVIDCGTPADYLRANLSWSGGRSVIGRGATVHGTVQRSVVWPGSHVAASEHLVDAIRAGSRTVLVR